jgi:ABC-type Fe3+-siderophore transport system permease subunit
METLGVVLAILGACISLVGVIWLAMVAFQESAWWGIGCFCLVPVAIIFAITHWDRAATPFMVYLAGFVLSAVGGILLEVQNPPLAVD